MNSKIHIATMWKEKYALKMYNEKWSLVSYSLSKRITVYALQIDSQAQVSHSP